MTAEKCLDELIEIGRKDVSYLNMMAYRESVNHILEALKPCIELLERDVEECERANDTENYEYDVKNRLLTAIAQGVR